jgi:hypothetical protein
MEGGDKWRSGRGWRDWVEVASLGGRSCWPSPKPQGCCGQAAGERRTVARREAAAAHAAAAGADGDDVVVIRAGAVAARRGHAQRRWRGGIGLARGEVAG